jgi:hypothetical protein
MTSKQTPAINRQNIDNVRSLIMKDQGYQPYHASIQDASGVLTDYDTFAYPRWYRGVYDSTTPIVAEREAGWRPRHDSCYDIVSPPKNIPSPYPNHCFASGCSTVYPCYPNYLAKYSDKTLLDLILNKGCIVQYR